MVTSRPRCARACDHLQAKRRFAQAHAGDVHHVQRRAGSGRIGQHFLQRIDRARLDRTAVAHVHVDRGLALRREAEDSRISARVACGTYAMPMPDAQRAFVQPAAARVRRISRCSPGVAARSRRYRAAASVPQSCITAMRAGMCPAVAPKLIGALPSRARTRRQPAKLPLPSRARSSRRRGL